MLLYISEVACIDRLWDWSNENFPSAEGNVRTLLVMVQGLFTHVSPKF